MLDGSSGDNSEDTSAELSDRAFWLRIADRDHRTDASTLLDAPEASKLPAGWSVININVSDDCNTLFISRTQRDHPPIMFSLPLDRQGRREEEDETFTFVHAITELRDIIATSDNMAHEAKTIEGRDGRMEWWAKRKALDARMKELLTNIEFCWLGAFKVSC
jgi:separase